MRNCSRDEGRPFWLGDQEPIPSHRNLLWSKAVVVSVAETSVREVGPCTGRYRSEHAKRALVYAAQFGGCELRIALRERPGVSGAAYSGRPAIRRPSRIFSR
jgi:hypothetical protein